MQAITELGFFDVTDKTVDTRDRFGCADVVGNAQIILDPQNARLIANIRLQTVPTLGIKPVRV